MRHLAAIAILATSVAQAQLTVTSKAVTILSGLESSQSVGSMLLVDEDAEIALQSVAIVEVQSEAKNISVEASDKNRTPVQIDQASPGVYILRTPGKVWVDVTAIDFGANLYDKKTVVVDVPSGRRSLGGSIEVPEPSAELQSLVAPIVVKLSTDPEKAERVAYAFSGFAQAVGAVGSRIKNVSTFQAINNAALRDLEMSGGVSIGAEIQTLMTKYLSLKQVEGGWEDRTLTTDDRTKIAEAFLAIAWSGTQ